ncbi:MAG TPA: oxygenase MpaB family protein [Gaiellaceae bacterium]|jgi:uncharacterized protein (DUF2236 family)|nr:oxygenase MpaB family protein [Gaiellaceae bacterium]
MVSKTHAERLRSRDGYFGPESIVRRLGDSPVTPLLGAGASVLLQVAHPLVAAGVTEHSGYDRDLWQRLVGTMRALYLITFGDKAEADRAAAVVRHVHTHVHGTTTCRLGTFPAGTPYAASDPELMLWVHATLVYSSLAAYQLFVETLAEGELERYHSEMSTVAELFGTPARVLPRSYREFRDYFDAQLASDTLTVTPPAREVASVILATPLPTALRVLAPAHRLATTRILPARLRREYKLHWTALHQLALPFAGHAVRYGTIPGLAIARRIRPPGHAPAA